MLHIKLNNEPWLSCADKIDSDSSGCYTPSDSSESSAARKSRALRRRATFSGEISAEL